MSLQWLEAKVRTQDAMHSFDVIMAEQFESEEQVKMNRNLLFEKVKKWDKQQREQQNDSQAADGLGHEDEFGK